MITKKCWAITLWKSGPLEHLNPSVLFSFNSLTSWEVIGKISIPWQALSEVSILLAKRSSGMHNLSTSYLLHVLFFHIYSQNSYRDHYVADSWIFPFKNYSFLFCNEQSDHIGLFVEYLICDYLRALIPAQLPFFSSSFLWSVIKYSEEDISLDSLYVMPSAYDFALNLKWLKRKLSIPIDLYQLVLISLSSREKLTFHPKRMANTHAISFWNT